MTFLKSCASLADLPAPAAREVALLGRSNVGKSSLLNCLADKHGLARVSGTPGRTRLLNLFFDEDAGVLWVDCPGYGYARASRSLRAAWGALTQEYLEARHPDCLLLVDATVAPQPLDLAAIAWLRRARIACVLIATKSDRLSGNGRTAALHRLTQAFGQSPLPFSSKTGEGREALLRQVRSLLPR